GRYLNCDICRGKNLRLNHSSKFQPVNSCNTASTLCASTAPSSSYNRSLTRSPNVACPVLPTSGTIPLRTAHDGTTSLASICLGHRCPNTRKTNTLKRSSKIRCSSGLHRTPSARNSSNNQYTLIG